MKFSTVIALVSVASISVSAANVQFGREGAVVSNNNANNNGNNIGNNNAVNGQNANALQGTERKNNNNTNNNNNDGNNNNNKNNRNKKERLGKGKKGRKGKKGEQGRNRNNNVVAGNAANSTLVASNANSTAVVDAAAANSTAIIGNAAANATAIVDAAANSTAIVDNNAANSTSTALIANAANGGATAAAVTSVRNRACDQGDQSLAAGMQANVIVGVGQQASVATLQGLVGGNAADFQTALTRLNQFMSTSALQLQMATGIADSASLAQPQLALLATSAIDQATQIKTLTGGAADTATLAALATSFATSTGVSMDGANNALIDCALPLTAVSG